ncbi:hypothetical protein [Reichenbachiella faecimaris]|nr:hypothetical protein [Reichenbachiella faecimaris]
MASSHISYAQLLTDRNKLKTARRESGFLQFKKKAKIKGPSGKHKTIAAGKTKYSQPSSKEGSNRNINPKFSVFTAGQSKGKKLNIRYTQSNAGKGTDRKVTPRYSVANAGQFRGKKINVRYTQSHAGAGMDRKVNPRYSVLNAGQVKGRKIAPRFTKTNAGEVKGRNISPRYSQWKQAGKMVIVKPRFTVPPTYNRTKPAGNRKKGFLSDFNLYRKPAKHKAGPNSQYAGVMKNKYQKPFHVGDHNQNIKSYKKYTNRNLRFSPNAQMANYELKTKKMRKKSDMHPSANYLSAKYYKNRTVRNTKRKFNVVWVRMHGNKIQPDAVKKKPKKAKFDKDEIEIWNN